MVAKEAFVHDAMSTKFQITGPVMETYFVEWNVEHLFKKNIILVNIGIAKKIEGDEKTNRLCLRNRFALAVICCLIYHWLEVSR